MICMKRSIAVVALALAMIACAVVVTDESDAQDRDNGFVWTPDIDTATLHEYNGNDTVCGYTLRDNHRWNYIHGYIDSRKRLCGN